MISNRRRAPIVIDKILRLPIIGPLIGHRFTKFGAVGFLGTVVNLVALYIHQEFIFKNIYPKETRLHLSLAVAIFLATVSNYLLNRSWTWADRKGKTIKSFFVQMGQYFVACGLAIGIQFGLTVLLARYMHYLIANVIAIILAAVFNYLLNDIWTFSADFYKKLDR